MMNLDQRSRFFLYAMFFGMIVFFIIYNLMSVVYKAENGAPATGEPTMQLPQGYRYAD